MANGTVKWFNATKGFGFIAPAHGSKDVFVHVSAMERAGIRQLNDGQAVTFDMETDRNGRESATNLVLAVRFRILKIRNWSIHKIFEILILYLTIKLHQRII